MLAVSSWTFHAPLYGGQMSLAAVPGAARALSFEAVTLQDLFLWPRGRRPLRWLARLEQAFSPAPRPRHYAARSLGPLRAALQQAGTRLAAWEVDTDFSAPNPRRTLAYAQLGLRAAHFLGAGVLRVTAGPWPPGVLPGTAAAAQHLERLAACLAALARQAAPLGIVVALENHHDAVGEPEALIAVLRRAAQPNLGACLDLGNFPPGQALAGVQALAPHARYVHAKFWAFDAQGRETRLDYPASLAALRNAGFRGPIAIEYEGDDDPEAAAWQARRVMEQTA